MTQPFADQIPLLRRLYAGRFSRVVFLIPFERVDDGDVITVYRAPYSRAGYITDANARLAEIDCDFFLVVDHDVILNPMLDEATLPEMIPLGPDDGFYPAVMPLPASIGAWSRYFGIVPKLAFPKSLLFGSGIEREVLAAHLPDKDEAVRRLAVASVVFRTTAKLETRTFGDVAAAPSRVLLHGETAPLHDGTAAQRAADQASLAVERGLVEAMAAAVRAETPAPSGRAVPGEAAAPLLMPLAAGTVSPCLYILPRGRLAAFAHYAGVASAANLDADLVVPTLLYILCERVWSAADYRLSLRGMTLDGDIGQLANPAVLAVHPVELARFQSPAAQARLLGELARLRQRRRRRAIASVGHHRLGLDGTPQGFAHRGWHRRESWGRWMSQPASTLRFWLPRDAPIGGARIGLVIPVHPRLDHFVAFVTINGGTRMVVRKAYPDAPEADLFLRPDELVFGGMNRIDFECPAMARPLELVETSGDRRRIGIGVSAIEFTPADTPDVAAPFGPLPPVGPERHRDRAPPGVIASGWHPPEEWGSWASERTAALRFRIDTGVTVQGLRLSVRTPIAATSRNGFSGSVTLNGTTTIRVVKNPGDPDAAEIIFPAETLHLEDENRITFVSDVLNSPIDDDPGCGDDRRLGFGLLSLAVISPALDALTLPTAGSARGEERFYASMQAERAGGAATPVAAFGSHPADVNAPRSFAATGWHEAEVWGRWSAFARATLQFWALGGRALRRVRLVLRAPPSADGSAATGRVRLNGGDWMLFSSDPTAGEMVEVEIVAREVAVSAINWIELVSDRLTMPVEIDPASTDLRRLGFGLVSISFA